MDSYSTDVEGGTPVQLRYMIEGRLDRTSYLAFVLDRATWLDIRGWAQMTADGRVEMVAAGPEALVGALEMACTLGPLDALVDDITGVADDEAVGMGFEIR